MPHEPLDHVPTHSAEADHCELHSECGVGEKGDWGDEPVTWAMNR
jgi:hypothetical protein